MTSSQAYNKFGLRNIYWPDVQTEDGATTAVRYGVWGASLAVGLSILWLASGLINSQLASELLVPAVNIPVFVWVLAGIHKRIRWIAAVGLTIYLAEEIYFWFTTSGGSVLLRMAVVFFLLHGVRGAKKGRI